MLRKVIVGITLLTAAGCVLVGLFWADDSSNGTAIAKTDPTPSIPTPSTTVNWCEGNQLSHTDAEAVTVFGKSAVTDARCDAVSFLFEVRYSRLALPRAAYATSDFADLAQWLSTDAYDNRFLPMVKTMIDDLDSKTKREALGLIIFHLSDSRPGDKAAAAGRDKTYAFLGRPFDGDGYAGRAVWINPKWKRITTGVDRRLGFDRLKINLEASASMPVFNTKLKRDDMMTVATEATFIMIPGSAGEGRPWRIDGWRVTTKDEVYAPLEVR